MDAGRVHRLLFFLPFVIVAAGCGRTMSDEDCKQIGDHLREVWANEAKGAAPPDGPAADRANGAIKSEGERLGTDWAAECKKELLGRRVDAREVDCLLKAKTIAEVSKCSEL